MSKKFKPKNSKFKAVAFSLATVATSCVMFAAACEAPATSNNDDDKTTTKIDTQLLKNGNFEFFDDNDGKYFISTAENWSSTSTTTPDSMSGIIGTSYDKWAAFTDSELPEELWANELRDSDDEDKQNYNGVMPEDLPFKNTHTAIVKDAVDRDEDGKTDDSALSEEDGDVEYIANPYTRQYRWDEDGKLFDAEGNEVTTYSKDGKLYLDEKYEDPVDAHTNVLMIHNYREADNYGTQTSYSPSVSLSLEANTAAKVSVWVKTSDLYFGGPNDTRTEVDGQRGAYIQIAQTVGGNTIDSFYIKNIDTSKLNPYNESTGTWEKGNNGWVEYTVYVNACDYSPTTISVTVGLGESTANTCEGYAFFDDISYEKYFNYEDMVEGNGGEEAFDAAVADTTCTLLSEAEDKIFPVDKNVINDQGNGGVVIDRYSDKNTYYIDLTSSATRTEIDFAAAATMGLTVDENNYVSSRNNDYTVVNANRLDNGAGNANLPIGIRENSNYANGLITANDVLANLNITSAAGWSSNIGGNYEQIIDDALRSAAALPGVENDSTDALLMLSAGRASYETVLTDESFTVGAGEYKIISFWVKTSEMKGNTAATFTVRDTSNDKNSAEFSVDSTTQPVITINDTEVYEGWTQCYILVANELENEEDAKQFEIVFNFGPTTIKDTTPTSYHGGWAAMTNFHILEVDEDAFGFADTSTKTATLTFNEENSGSGNAFDKAFGNGNEIQSGIARPANYNGVNGNSATVKNVATEITGYDAVNENDYAGLISKEYYDNYKTYIEDHPDLFDNNLGSTLKALFSKTWEELTGTNSTSVQPLLIVNAVREIAGKSGIYNYGYIGKSTTYSSDSYTATSVRVKVTGNAVAKVYLVDSTTKEVMGYSLPEYTFWYDEEGNVLYNEPDADANETVKKANIAYFLRDDGLYEDRDGNLFANIYNLTREYYSESESYFDSNGVQITFDELEKGKIYYSNASKTAYSGHYLVTDDGERIYSYASGTGTETVYNYMVNETVDETTVKKVNTNYSVKGFKIADENDASSDGIHLRYDNRNCTTFNPYCFTIDTIANPELMDKWVTVRFYVHTGSETKNYRLELWSGSRDSEQTAGVEENSYVMFDYDSVSLSESTYNALMSYYNGEIVKDYVSTLIENGTTEFDTTSDNLDYFAELAGSKSDKYNYEATYYTFTLYDSSNYVPFNKETAGENETGYDYNYADYAEKLSFLKVEDYDNESNPVKSMFIDYSTMEQTVSVGTAPESPEEDDHDDHEHSDDETNVWMLASSIALVAAIVLVLIAMMVRSLLKNRKRKKTSSKNTYNYNKNKRYVKTYIKANGEAPVSEDKDDEAEVTDETPADEAAEEAQPEAEATETEGQTDAPSDEDKTEE